MNKADVVNRILTAHSHAPTMERAEVFAPTNIAITKYWGKRDMEINLPVTDSLSISLGNKGTTTRFEISKDNQDHFLYNHEAVPLDSDFSKRLSSFLDLFRFINQYHFKVDSHSNIPLAAGLASSASGFCALVKAMDLFFGWNLSLRHLSILARLGSGSACRSIADGFVIWHRGEEIDGMDSYGEPLPQQWPDLRIGLIMISSSEKAVSSRTAMKHSVGSSRFYQLWPEQVASDLYTQRNALARQDFQTFGQSVECNALAMHSTIHTAIPPFSYWLPQTMAVIHQVWKCRDEGIPVYFTEDAGPNLKLFFLSESTNRLLDIFPNMEIIEPFPSVSDA